MGRIRRVLPGLVPLQTEEGIPTVDNEIAVPHPDSYAERARMSASDVDHPPGTRTVASRVRLAWARTSRARLHRDVTAGGVSRMAECTVAT